MTPTSVAVSNVVRFHSHALHFSLIDRGNAGLSTRNMTLLLIGFTVAALISLFAPLTQAGWNPARDFGPRLVAFFAGWGEIAIPGPSNGF